MQWLRPQSLQTDCSELNSVSSTYWLCGVALSQFLSLFVPHFLHL